MPMSCSRPRPTAAPARSDRRRAGRPRRARRTARRQRRNVPRVRDVDVVVAGEVVHAGLADVVEQLADRHRQRSKNSPSRRPASVTSTPSTPQASSAPRTTIAPARITSARAGLDARGRRALGRRQRREAARSAHRARRVDHVAADAERRQRACRWSAAARVRAVPPIATRRCVGARASRASSSVAGDVLAQPVELLAVAGRRLRGSARSSARRRAATRRPRVASRPTTRTSCIEPPPRSSTAPSASVVELIAAR